MSSHLSRNSLHLGLARVASQAGFAVFSILVARLLGTQAFGEYAFMASIIVVGNTLTTFGTDMLLIREIAASEDESLLSLALWLQLALSALYILLVFILSFFLQAFSPQAIVAIRIYALSLLPLALFTVCTTSLRGHQRMLEYASLNVALVLMQVLAALALYWFHGGLILLGTLLLIIQCAAAALAAGLSRVRLFIVPPALRSTIAGLLASSAPIALLSIVGVLYQRLALLLLPSLAGTAATGLFSAAARLVESAKLVHLAVFTAIYPMMAQARGISWTRFFSRFRQPWWFLLGLAAVAAFTLSIMAGPLVRILYGSGYAGAAPLLRLLAWILIPYSINGFLGLVFLARGQARSLLGALSAAALTLGLLTLVLVPRLGAPGAVLAVLSAEVIQSVILLMQYARFSQSSQMVPKPSLGLPTRS